MKITLIQAITVTAILAAISSLAQETMMMADVNVSITSGLDDKAFPGRPTIKLTADVADGIEDIRNKLVARGFYPTGELEGYLRYVTEAGIATDSVPEGQSLFPEVSDQDRQKIPDGFFLKLDFYPEAKARIASQSKELEAMKGQVPHQFDPVINNTLMLHSKINAGQIFVTFEYLDEVVAQADLLQELINKREIGELTNKEQKILKFIETDAKRRAEKLQESLSNSTRISLDTRMVRVHVRSKDGQPVPNAKIYMRGRVRHIYDSGHSWFFGISDPAKRTTQIDCGDWYFWAKKAGSEVKWKPELLPVIKQRNGEEEVQEFTLMAD